MDIEFPQSHAPWQTIFEPINHFPTNVLYHQNITLENTFSTHPHQHPNVMLTLIGNTLLLSDPTTPHIQPQTALSFTFDLKFQVLFHTHKNISSPKIGIRLFYSHERTFSFYSAQPSLLDMWVTHLSQHLNQLGFHDFFKPYKKLGKGNFASVYEVERLTDKQRFAVKAFSKQGCFNARNGKESLINQLNVMRCLSREAHHNVLKLEGVYESDNSIYVVLELLSGGQLFHKIQQRNGYFSSSEAKTCMKGLLQGLQHMHSKRLMHRDLKPENIMLRPGNKISPVIVDFGLATSADLDKYLFYRCGTPGYVAPEIITLTENSHIEPQCDVFSAGVIFHILLTRKQIFEGSRYDEVYKKNKEMNIQLEGERYRQLDHQAVDLLKKMLVVDPNSRITAEHALNHPYFKEEEEQMEESKVSSPCLTEASSKASAK